MTDENHFDVVICGAGIAGISAAYTLAEKGISNSILLVDEREPLSLTSDKSSECFRNWWPDPAMVRLMNHSIDLLEELAEKNGNCFHLNRRGYLFVSCDTNRTAHFLQEARSISQAGGGPLRVWEGKIQSGMYQPAHPEAYQDQPVGADLFIHVPSIRENFPYLSEKAALVLHARRAGWFSAHQMGMFLLGQARKKGINLLRGRIERITLRGGRVKSVHLADGRRIGTNIFINAAGPHLKQVGKLLGVDLPVFCEFHQKAAFRDTLGVLPRRAPLIINLDRQVLPWSQEERQALMEDKTTQYLVQELPGGAHTRPEGGELSQILLLLWDFHTQVVEPEFPPIYDPFFPELALRGLVHILPGLERYVHHLSRPIVDGGFYTRTVDNRPLIGKLPVEGAFISGAYSGYGLMAALGAAELLINQITGPSDNDYAQSFVIERFADPLYLARLNNWGETGQL